MSEVVETTKRTKPLWYYHLMALATITIWSFSFLFIVTLNRQMTPVGVVVLRMEIFAFFVLALLFVRRPRLRGLTPRNWFVIIGLGLVGGPVYHMIFSWSAGTNGDGVSRIDPGLLGLILATVPVHAGWLAWIFLGERLTKLRVAALVMGLTGVAVVLWGRYGSFDVWPADRIEGPIAATIAAVFGGGLATLTRASRTFYQPVEIVIVSGVFMVLFVGVLHPWGNMGDVLELDAAGWLAAAFLGVLGLGTAFLTWATALSRLSAVTAAMYLFLASVLSALWGYLFDGTAAGWSFAGGAVIVLAAIMLMAMEGSRNNGRAAAPDSATTLPGEAAA